MSTTNLFLAKTNPRKTIWEHTDEVLACYLSLKHVYPYAFPEVIWKAIETAIHCHDLGKINYRFQNMLYEALKLPGLLPDVLKEAYLDVGVAQIPHGILSLLFLDFAQCSEVLGKETALGILWAVCLHHHRQNLMKLLSEADCIAKIIREDLKKSIADYPFKGEFILANPDESNHYELDETQLSEISQWSIYARIKGILNRADYAASGGLDKLEIDPLQDGETVAQIVERNLPGLREVQQYMAGHQEENLLVIASTGIGKTEAALLWNGGRKMFYTLPLRVSINSIYARIKIRYGYRNVELLHSDALTYYLEEAEENPEEVEISPFIRYNQARLLAAPLTVCTVDQLFKFVFKCNGYEAMFATLTYSNVVIDELQMYSPGIIACILYGLKLISDAGGRFAIITATFPTVLMDFIRKLKIPLHKPEKVFFNDVGGPRHWIALRQGDFDIDEILAAGKTKKVLVITNTVKKAQKLYKSLRDVSPGDVSIRLLHSNFIAQDRRLLEADIINFSEGKTNESQGIWICTQVVEASLDIDFDILFTEMSIADSLLQRMGRCYRKRKYSGDTPNVIIHATGNGIGTVYDRSLYQFSWNALQPYNNCFMDEQCKQIYIDQVYDPALNPGIKDTKYYKEIGQRLDILQSLSPLKLERKEVDDRFRDIRSVGLIPDSIYNKPNFKDKVAYWTEKLNEAKLQKEEKIRLLAEIQEYVVNVRWHPKLIYDKTELFFKGSGFYRSRLKYEFDDAIHQGFGLITDQEEVDNFQ